MFFPKKRFYFMRHGETVLNSMGLLAGSTDTPLTEKGRKQARTAQSVVNKLPITKIYYSPLIRTYDTAVLANESKKAELCSCDSLKAWSMGDWEGTPYQEVRNKFLQGQDPANGETKNDFRKRIYDGLQNLLKKESSPFLIVAHGEIFSSWIRCIPIHTNIKDVSNCTVIEIFNNQDVWCAVEIEN